MGLDWYPQCAYIQSSKGRKQMTTITYHQIGRSTFRIVRTNDEIFITRVVKHGPLKDVPVDSELGRKILAEATR
jgi:hypothetical protein